MSGMPDTNERDIVTELKMGRFESPYLQRAIDEIESLREQVESLTGALNKIRQMEILTKDPCHIDFIDKVLAKGELDE
jgi:hypothetical protein